MKTSQVVVDIAVAAAFFLVAWPVETALVTWTGVETRFGPFGVALVGAMIAAIFSGALAFRRASPGLALGIAWVGALLQVGLGRPPSFSDLAIFAVLYASAAYGTRVVYWAGLGSALAGALVITAYLFSGPLFVGAGLSWRTLPLALVMLVAAGFALGLAWTIGALVRTAVRARENRRAQERAEAEAVAEQERVRIARDMHDVVAHSLAVVIAQADGARYAIAAGPGAGDGGSSRATDPALAGAALATISSTARSALADVRLLLTRLRHSEGDGPQPSLADLEELYAQVRAAGVDLRVDVDPAPPEEPPAGTQLAVYRILQEALTNAIRHGGGGAVSVRLAWSPGTVDLEVRNPVPAGDRTTESGHGVIGMRERAQLAGGRLEVADQDGWFVVSGSIPVGSS